MTKLFICLYVTRFALCASQLLNGQIRADTGKEQMFFEMPGL